MRPQDELAEVRESFIRLWGALGSFWGVPPTTARVYGWLLSRAEGGEADEIMAGLELSRGAVSMACRELRDWGLVVPEKISGSRRIRYRPETDFEKVMRNILQVRKRREWDPILDNITDWIPRLERDPSPEAQIFLERLRAIEGLVTLMDSMAEVFLHGGTVGAFGLKALVRTASRPQRKERSKKDAG